MTDIAENQNPVPDKNKIIDKPKPKENPKKAKTLADAGYERRVIDGQMGREVEYPTTVYEHAYEPGKTDSPEDAKTALADMDLGAKYLLIGGADMGTLDIKTSYSMPVLVKYAKKFLELYQTKGTPRIFTNFKFLTPGSSSEKKMIDALEEIVKFDGKNVKSFKLNFDKKYNAEMIYGAQGLFKLITLFERSYKLVENMTLLEDPIFDLRLSNDPKSRFVRLNKRKEIVIKQAKEPVVVLPDFTPVVLPKPSAASTSVKTEKEEEEYHFSTGIFDKDGNLLYGERKTKDNNFVYRGEFDTSKNHFLVRGKSIEHNGNAEYTAIGEFYKGNGEQLSQGRNEYRDNGVLTEIQEGKFSSEGHLLEGRIIKFDAGGRPTDAYEGKFGPTGKLNEGRYVGANSGNKVLEGTFSQGQLLQVKQIAFDYGKDWVPATAKAAVADAEAILKRL